MKHLLHDVELDSSSGFVLSDTKVIQQVMVTQIRGIRVSMLVGQPLPLVCVCMARADILGLQMFKLTVDVVAVTHDYWKQSKQSDHY